MAQGPPVLGEAPWDPEWGIWGPPRPRGTRDRVKAALAALLAVGRQPGQPHRGIAILAYHSTPADRSHPAWVDFRGHLELLADSGYDVISLDEVVRRLTARETPGRAAVAITFDDGWRTNLDVAFPELARRGWPATVFVCSGMVGRRPFLTLEELRSLAPMGIEVGNHTDTHPDFTLVPSGRIVEEVAVAARRLEDWVAAPVRHFCYPFGRYTSEAQGVVAQAGLASACSGRVGHNRPGQDLFALRRYTVTIGDGRPDLRRRLVGGYDFSDWKQRVLGPGGY